MKPGNHKTCGNFLRKEKEQNKIIEWPEELLWPHLREYQMSYCFGHNQILLKTFL
jgi:hypothetical protein